MAFSGGTFSRTFDCTTDRDNGVKILASKFDTELDGFATGLSTCILKDGTQTCTAAIPFAEGLTVPDNKTIVLGTNSDITIQYDETTNDALEIAANVEGAALGVVLKADQGDDNADQWKVNVADGGTLSINSKISGSFVSQLTLTPNATAASSTTAIAGNITVGGTVDGRDLATDGSKLDGIEASADVTDTANVTAAGALMDSEVTNLAQVKSFDSADYATAAQGSTADSALQNVSEDSTPQLGGNLDVQTNSIVSTSNRDINISPNGTGTVVINTDLDVDNININGNTISSTDTNGDINVTPNGTGDVVLGGDVKIADSDVLYLGTGLDLQIQHNGSGSFITDSGTGDLHIRTDTNLNIQNAAGTESKAVFATDGAVTLYHDNSAKIATSAAGIDVTGTVTSDGASLDGAVVINESSADVDFRVESNDQTHMLFVDAGNNNIGIKNSSPDTESVLDLGSGENTNHTRKLNIVNTGNSRAGFGALSNIFRMYYADDQAIQFGTLSRDGNFTFSEKARLHAGGAFSIGTDSAPSKFTVSNAGTDNIIEAANTSNSVRAGMQADTSVVGIGAISNHSVDFRTNATARMRLHQGGDLSLGTTTATGLFNLENGDNGEPVIQAKCTSTTFNHDLLKLICSRSGATTEFNAITLFTNNTDLKFLVRPDGDLENANNSYGALSDQNLKENIVDAGSQWDDLKALRVRKYNLIGETATHIGVVAQEVEAAGMGGLVALSTNTETQQTHKSMKYSVLYMKAIKALQEAMTRIETLETQNTTQATQIADLITRVTALEAGG